MAKSQIDGCARSVTSRLVFFYCLLLVLLGVFRAFPLLSAGAESKVAAADAAAATSVSGR